MVVRDSPIVTFKWAQYEGGVQGQPQGKREDMYIKLDEI